jgi:exodeoxyribonuclease VII small subunit
VDFEKALRELEGLVETLERGELGLEDSLKLFEQGIGLTRRCQSALTEAEQKIEQLLGADEHASIEPFEPES